LARAGLDEDAVREVDRGRGKARRSVLHHLELMKGQLNEHVGDAPLRGLDFHLSRSEVAVEEDTRGGDGHVELELVQDQDFHLHDLIAVVGVVGDVLEIAQFRRVDLLVLGSDEHGGDAHELELLARDDLLGQVAVDQVDGQVEDVRGQLELVVNLDEPVNEDGAHLLVDVGLDGHVVRVGEVLGLDLFDPREDVAAILSHVQLIILVLGINLQDLALARRARGRGAGLGLVVEIRLGATTAKLGAGKHAGPRKL